MSFKVLAAGAPARRKLDQVRAKLTALDDEIDNTTVAAKSPEQAAADAMTRAEPVIENARRQLDTFLHWRDRDDPRPRLDLDLSGSSAAGASLHSLLVLHDALTDDAVLRKRLVAYFKAHGLGDGISADERAAKLRDLAARRLELLADEERETRALEREGCVVERNIDVDPAVLLAVWDPQAA